VEARVTGRILKLGHYRSFQELDKLAEVQVFSLRTSPRRQAVFSAPVCNGSDPHCSRTVLPASHVKLDWFAFFEAVEIQLQEAAAMEEYLAPVTSPDKTESVTADDCANHPLHAKPRFPWAARDNAP
jgi:hypothetical protein